MNPGQFAGIGGGVLPPASVPIGGTVRFPATAPLEVITATGEVYLRAGELMPPISRYNGRVPGYLTSLLGASTVGVSDAYTTGPSASANRTLFAFDHASQVRGLALTSSAANICPLIASNNDITATSVGSLPSLMDTVLSVGGVAVSFRGFTTNPIIQRTTDADFTLGWSTPYTSTLTTNGPSSALILNSGTNWIAVVDGAGSAGVYYRSTDNGVSWSEAGITTVLPEVATAATDLLLGTTIPTTNTVLVVINGTANGSAVRRSTDGGSTFSLVQTLPGNRPTQSLERVAGVAAVAGLAMIITFNNLVYTSTDDGVTWNLAGRTPALAFANRTCVQPGSTNNRLYARNGRFWIHCVLSNDVVTKSVVYSSVDGQYWNAGYVPVATAPNDNPLLVHIGPTAVHHWQAFTTTAARRDDLPYGQYVNNALHLETSTAASGSFQYLRVA